METNFTKIAITLKDGSVSILSFIHKGYGSVLPHGASWVNDGQDGLWEREINDENIFFEIARSYSTDQSAPVSYRIVFDHEIPQDRTYRGAWVDKGDCLDHDMDKCKDIHISKLRRERAAEFDKLDKEWMKAFSQGNTVLAAEIEAKRQALRDMPLTLAPTINAATTPDELKEIRLSSVVT